MKIDSMGHRSGYACFERMTEARNNATNGIPFVMPEWNKADLERMCRMHVDRYEEERKYWRDAAWKRYVKQRYVKCSAWLLAHS